MLTTRCGPIKYQEAGTGVPLLAVHGSGGGHDQGIAFAGTLASQGTRVIAMSRFGYLRKPMPADACAAAQADAHVCLLDALGIPKAAVMGGSAGAPSALRHRRRAAEVELVASVRQGAAQQLKLHPTRMLVILTSPIAGASLAVNDMDGMTGSALPLGWCHSKCQTRSLRSVWLTPFRN